jgi:hypothetical protein
MFREVWTGLEGDDRTCDRGLSDWNACLIHHLGERAARSEERRGACAAAIFARDVRQSERAVDEPSACPTSRVRFHPQEIICILAVE